VCFIPDIIRRTLSIKIINCSVCDSDQIKEITRGGRVESERAENVTEKSSVVSKRNLAIVANNLSVAFANYNPVNFHVRIIGRFCRQFVNYEFDSRSLFTVALNTSVYQNLLCTILSNIMLRALIIFWYQISISAGKC